MPQFFPDHQDGKFVVFVVGPMGADNNEKRSVIDRFLRRRRELSTRVSDHTRNIAEAARQVLEERGLAPDQYEVYFPEQIFDADIVASVFHKIDSADFAIADITNRSPNVFYEIAYFNALGTPLIIIDGSRQTLPFYWRHARINTLPELTVGAVKNVLKPRMDAYFSGQGIDLTTNPISSFYGAPLIDVSASSGVAVGFFENFAFHVLVAGGVLATYPDLDELVIIRPNRINNFAKDNKRVRAALRDARDETRDARSHPRGAVRVNIVGKSIVDFPTPLYALQRAPRYRRFAKQINSLGLPEDVKDAATASMEAKLIESYFRTLKYLISTESNITASALRIVNIDDLAGA
jgi:hypothetical protein